MPTNVRIPKTGNRFLDTLIQPDVTDVAPTPIVAGAKIPAKLGSEALGSFIRGFSDFNNPLTKLLDLQTLQPARLLGKLDRSVVLRQLQKRLRKSRIPKRTQEVIRNLVPNEREAVDLFRNMSEEEFRNLQRGVRSGSALRSFTLDPEVARRFQRLNKGGKIIQQEVPFKAIRGPGLMQSEAELLVDVGRLRRPPTELLEPLASDDLIRKIKEALKRF